MNILDRVERGLERAMEGSIGRLFRSPVQPAEIGQKLERAMSEHPVVSVQGRLVPNRYVVRLHPLDLAPFAAYQAALSQQLERWLEEVARRRGFSVVDQISVELVAGERLPRRAIEVAAAIAEHAPAVPDDRRAAGAPHRRRHHDPRQARRLRFLNGPQRNLETTLSQAATTVGRAPGNDLVLDVGDVSRHHARLEWAGDELRVVDLGSTNGTSVNGTPVRSSPLRPGDEVSFGTIRARVTDAE